MLKIPDKAGTIYAKYANVSPECQFAKITNEPEVQFFNLKTILRFGY